MDILTLSAFCPRPFKYISKIEVLRIPLIGWSMGFAGHIALRRTSKSNKRPLEEFEIRVCGERGKNPHICLLENYLYSRFQKKLVCQARIAGRSSSRTRHYPT